MNTSFNHKLIGTAFLIHIFTLKFSLDRYSISWIEEYQGN